MRGTKVVLALTAILASVGAAPRHKKGELMTIISYGSTNHKAHYSNTSQIAHESSNGEAWVLGPPNPVEAYLRNTTGGEQYAKQFIKTSVVTPGVPVETIPTSSGTIQLIPTISRTARSGSLHTWLDTTAPMPLLTSSIPIPTTTIATTGLFKTRIAEISSQMKSANIFQPIATVAPPGSISSRSDHPQSPIGAQSRNVPLGTNKFYGNLLVGSQASRVWTHPYTLAWARGSGDIKSWGMAITYDAERRVYGPAQLDVAGNPVRYFIHAAGIQSIVLSALSLSTSTTLTTDSIAEMSINVNLASSPGSAPAITFPLVQGMGFVTGIYAAGTDTPLLQSNVNFKSIAQVDGSIKPGITKFRISLNDGTDWLVYAYSRASQPIQFTLVDSTTIQGTSNFNGYIQIARSISPAAESLFDANCGGYPIAVSKSASTDGAMGSYSFEFTKAGATSSPLVMFALPHHVQSFSPRMNAALSPLQMNTSTKGAATAVVADSWDLVESLPVDMGFGPWSPSNSKKQYSAASLNAMSRAAMMELSQDMDAQSNQGSVYGAGKVLSKFAQIVYVMHDVVQDLPTAQAGLVQLKMVFSRWAENRQSSPFNYDTIWGGIVSSASYSTGDPGLDYGNSFYNDHHFHYGYLVYAASIIGYLDPSWLTADMVSYVNALVRDYANPSTQDNYFPVSRCFDWYHGHSWAHGITEYGDGKDQESSSEDTMSTYAIKMWGKTIGDANMEARGNLQLAITARSLQNYFLYSSSNTIQPANFIANKVSGILFENKIDHVTYFGANTEYVQGIHMIPLLPSSTLTRTTQFVREEWEAYFSGGRVDKIEGGWKGILFANLAIVDPVAAWNFFSQPNFNMGWLDGGASLTWYLAFAAGLGGAP